MRKANNLHLYKATCNEYCKLTSELDGHIWKTTIAMDKDSECWNMERLELAQNRIIHTCSATTGITGNKPHDITRNMMARDREHNNRHIDDHIQWKPDRKSRSGTCFVVGEEYLNSVISFKPNNKRLC